MSEQTQIRKISVKSLLTESEILLFAKNKVVMVENQNGQYQGYFGLDSMVEPTFKLSRQNNNLNILPVVSGG